MLRKKRRHTWVNVGTGKNRVRDWRPSPRLTRWSTRNVEANRECFANGKIDNRSRGLYVTVQQPEAQ